MLKETHEGGLQHEHSMDHAVEFFSKAGSLFTKRGSFYGQETTAQELFRNVWIADKPTAFRLLLWLRDCRGGAGNRSGFRECLRWLAENDPMGLSYIKANIGWIPEVGRWDDLRALYGTSCQTLAAEMWAAALRENNVLAAKWADRKKDWLVKHELGLKVAEFRRLLVRMRKDGIVEHKMSTNRWNEIDYHTVPSLAMARYTNAFGRHDYDRFCKYKKSLEKGETTIHADVLFPHDCVRTVFHGDEAIAEAQFDALPNYMEEANERVIVISDTSRSMSNTVSGSIQAVHISQGMALYCSAKIAEDNPFHKKFVGFCDEGKFKNWNGMTFAEAVRSRKIFDGAIGGTQIDASLNLILDTAKFFNLANEQLPTTLLIISDMQFWHGVHSKDGTEVEKALHLWDEAGYNRPKIIYWNTAGYAGSPATIHCKDTALVSGFSPAILKAIFAGTDLSPKGVMLRALEKYDIEIPE